MALTMTLLPGVDTMVRIAVAHCLISPCGELSYCPTSFRTEQVEPHAQLSRRIDPQWLCGRSGLWSKCSTPLGVQNSLKYAPSHPSIPR